MTEEFGVKIGRVSLEGFSTDELVAELKTRHELCPVVDEMTREPVCLFVMTTESLVKELSKRNGVEKGSRPAQAGGNGMIDEKICPFMSKPGTQMHTIGLVDSVYCQKERCMAWESHHPVDEYDTFEGGICRLIP